MSMSTHIVGFRQKDELWYKMEAVYKSCKSAKIAIPKEVNDFFEGEDPTWLHGKEIELKNCVKEYNTDSRSGFEVDITKLPKDVKILLFFNSY